MTSANVQSALTWAQQQGVTRLEAQMLLLHSVGRDLHDRVWLLSHDTETLDPLAHLAFQAQVARRLAHVPLAYITGQKEFFGLSLQVDARVLDPRADTEVLVEWALSCLADIPSPQVVDLGTGSGAIALALKHSRSEAQVWAVDLSADALAVAQANADRLALSITWRQGAWCAPLGEAQFDAIVSNPPYVADHDPHLEHLQHEPLQALTSGHDGLNDIRQIVQQAGSHLRPGGWLLMEHGFDQALAVHDLLLNAGFEQVQSRPDLAGILRCTGGRWPTMK
ncbi:protein-(glutamine-N5) methyltransferase, release factor-specific [Limnohabitans sp. JirII-29]|uniref:peptide chain release factor N(5)-glutamine methyltransferase n=1 Tax=Limnohabitans sp. JirII-29 TaxID=1835756 RepID=UPI000D36A900|nr:peptide chain release factor N(5)-glutamine methyltransferase [Limnohabitans sp. JirII-29]PUE23055.1 protein-(glutamine-N5) methyltransferase, release factor-specific [Limnohabitans sp. JirII-29]